MKPEPSPEGELTGPAHWGVIAGTTAAVVLEECDALPGIFQATDPLHFTISVLLVFASGGAALFVTVVVLWERLRRRSGRRKRS
jgi:hypothetical protein